MREGGKLTVSIGLAFMAQLQKAQRMSGTAATGSCVILGGIDELVQPRSIADCGDIGQCLNEPRRETGLGRLRLS